MGIKLFFSPVPSTLILKTLNHFRSNFSILSDSNNVANSNVLSQNLFLHFVTARLNMSSADAAKMLKRKPSLGRLKTLDNVEQFVSIFHKFGCKEDQIAYIIRSQPFLLTVSADRLLEPKIQLLKDFGMGGENLSKIVSRLPWILTSKLEVLRSNLELLKNVFPTQDSLVRAIGHNHLILGQRLQNSFKPSVAFWEDFGFRGTELTRFLLVNPQALKRTSLSPEQLDLIRRIGIPKESNMYKYVVSIVAVSRIEVLEARIHNLQVCGLSPEAGLQVVRAEPLVLNKLAENIKKRIDFMLNHMKLSVDFVAKHPRLLIVSLDKVIRPRFLVLQKTAMDGVGKVNPSRLLTMLMMPEAKFVAQIIQGHPESAALWTVYKNAIVDDSKNSKISNKKMVSVS